jgi:uncharacterized protein YqjF (DUF2071 family)
VSGPGVEIDRVLPTRRPPGRAALRQRWAELLFLHWTVPAEALRPRLPLSLSVDTFEGRAYVGLVPFTMTGVRPLWAPPFSPWSDFRQVNVRTYVHLGGREPGVWFFSLDASNPLAVLMARFFFKLPYHLARMRFEYDGEGAVRYTSDRRGARPARCTVRCTPCGPAGVAPPGSLEYFLAERYVLYTQGRGSLYRGRVHHHPYPLQPARVDGLEETLLAAAGLTRPEEAPLAHYAREVSAEVFPLERLAPQEVGSFDSPGSARIACDFAAS